MVTSTVANYFLLGSFYLTCTHCKSVINRWVYYYDIKQLRYVLIMSIHQYPLKV